MSGVRVPDGAQTIKGLPQARRAFVVEPALWPGTRLGVRGLPPGGCSIRVSGVRVPDGAQTIKGLPQTRKAFAVEPALWPGTRLGVRGLPPGGCSIRVSGVRVPDGAHTIKGLPQTRRAFVVEPALSPGTRLGVRGLPPRGDAASACPGFESLMAHLKRRPPTSVEGLRHCRARLSSRLVAPRGGDADGHSPAPLTASSARFRGSLRAAGPPDRTRSRNAGPADGDGRHPGQPVVTFTVHAPDAVRSSTSTRTFSPGTVKLSPAWIGASARGG